MFFTFKMLDASGKVTHKKRLGSATLDKAKMHALHACIKLGFIPVRDPKHAMTRKIVIEVVL